MIRVIIAVLISVSPKIRNELFVLRICVFWLGPAPWNRSHLSQVNKANPLMLLMRKDERKCYASSQNVLSSLACLVVYVCVKKIPFSINWYMICSIVGPIVLDSMHSFIWNQLNTKSKWMKIGVELDRSVNDWKCGAKQMTQQKRAQTSKERPNDEYHSENPLNEHKIGTRK